MKNRKICLILAVICVISCVFFTIIFSIKDRINTDEEKYIKENIKSAFNSCIKNNECTKKDTKINEINSKYFKADIKEKLESYSLDSYIIYQTNEVILIK